MRARFAALCFGLFLVGGCRYPAPPVVDPASGLALVSIPAGEFLMGSPVTEIGRGTDEDQHRVTLTHAFYLGQHEVTEEEWRRTVGDNPANHQGCDRCPVERISFYDVERFLAVLNSRSRAFRYRLPTEAEWEYGCRAGTLTAFATGSELTTTEANFDDAPASRADSATAPSRGTVPVASYAPNPWGLFDMEGNVWEWTSDWYGSYPTTAVRDPTGPASGDLRVIRGGSFFFDASSARCAGRYHHRPQDLGFSLGVRVAADLRSTIR